MELGALVCIPGVPKCESCPVSGLCLGFREGTAAQLPVKRTKKARRVEERTVFLLIGPDGRAALEKRPPKGLLAGMWQLPNEEGRFTPEQGRRLWEKRGFSVERAHGLPEAVHVFSHIEWHMTGIALFLRELSVPLEPPVPPVLPVPPVAEPSGRLDLSELPQRQEKPKEKNGLYALDGMNDPEFSSGGRREEAPALVWASLEEIRREKALPAAFRAYRKAFERIAENAENGENEENEENGSGEDSPEQLMFPV